MKKLMLKYGGVVAFYLVIICGVFLVNYRFTKVHNKVYNKITYFENK